MTASLTSQSFFSFSSLSFSAFIYLLSLLLSAIFWTAVPPLQPFPAFGVVLAIVFQASQEGKGVTKPEEQSRVIMKLTFSCLKGIFYFCAQGDPKLEEGIEKGVT